jgi:hypothetical protein
MVQGVANELWHARAIRAEFLKVRGISRDIFLRNAAGAHRAPFVMIPVKPDLGDVTVTLILCDLLGREMAVIVDNGLIFGVLMEQAPRSFG